MTKEIKAYLSCVNEFLKKTDDRAQRLDFAASMLIRIEFYQHERLVHLIVMALFAVLTIISFVTAMMGYTELFLLFGLFLILLVPYIGHYYFLENSVQTLYKLYYELTGGSNEK